MSDELTAEHWLALHQAIRPHLGAFGSYELTFRCTDNVVRFFVSSTKDLGVLSNDINGVVLRPAPKDELTPPRVTAKERFLEFAPGANLLEMRERYMIKRSKGLEFARFTFRNFGPAQAEFYFRRQGNHWTLAKRLITKFPAHLLAINFAENTRYLKKLTPKYLDIEKSLQMLSGESTGALFSVDTFPYFAHNYYLALGSYEFDKHSFVIGASGSGKSKLIELLIDRLQHTATAMNYRVVVIDPHASLEQDLRHQPNTRIVNFSGETAQLFPKSNTDVSASTELTTTLLLSLMSNTGSSRLERVLRFSLFTLFVGQCMSLPMLKTFLTDLDVRGQLLAHVQGYVPDNIIHFFGGEFNEIRAQHYAEALAPIIALVDEMQLQPTLHANADQSLGRMIQDNFLTVFSLNKVSMGERVVKTVAGLLIQQIFLLAQARVFGQKVILVVDEVSVVQNPALASILAEARKFNLTVILSQQYFGQIEANLRSAILSNVVNYYVFRVSEEDARALEANLTIELPKEIVQEAAKRGLKETDIRVKIMTELHPRECLVRVAAGGKVLPAVRGRTVDTPHRVADVVGSTQLKPYAQQNLPAQFVPQITAQTQTPEEQAPLQRISNLVTASMEQLLSSTSSSRRKIRKDQ